MASVQLGFMLGTAGFSRLVALKRMHAGLAHDPIFAARFEHEVMLGARLRHPNVVQALDVIESHGELLLVMEFIHGENLAGLLRAAQQASERLPLQVVLAVIASALHGLHAAHEAVDAEGAPLQLVHRDFSPQNVLIGSDGHTRVLDFGVAKSSSQSVVTRNGHIAGKAPYMSPEQVRGETLDRRSDVFSVGVVLWEALTGARLFGEKSPDSPATLLAVVSGPIAAPSRFRPIPAAVERAVLRALNRDRSLRFPSAREFALQLEATGEVAGPTLVAECVQTLCAGRLQQLSQLQARASRAMLEARRAAEASEALTAMGPPVSAKTAGAAEYAGTSRTPQVADRSPRSVARSSRTRRTLGVIAALLLAAALGVLLWERHSQPPPVAVTQVDPPNPTRNAAIPPPVVAAPVEPSSEPVAEVSAPSPLPVTHPRAAAQQPHRAPPPACAQPTYLDERGIRHFKPQCL